MSSILTRLAASALVLTAATPSLGLAAGTPVWTFDAEQKWVVAHDRHKPKPTYDKAYVADGLGVTVGPTSERVSLQTYARSLGGHERLHDLQAFELDIDLVRGDAGSVLITFKDEAGERFTFRTRPLEPGRNTVRWEAPRDFHRQEIAPAGGLKLFNMRVQTADATDGPTEFLLREARALMFTPLDESLAVSVETGDPLHFLRPGDARGVWAAVRNKTGQPMRGRVRTALTTRFTEPPRYGEPRSLDLPAGRTVEVDFGPGSAATPGVFYAHWLVEIDDGRHLAGMSSYAVLDPVGQTPGVDPDDFVFGTAGFHREWSSPRERVELISRLASIIGIEANRFGTEWRGTEPKQGEYRWEYLDRFVETTIADGMEPQLLVSFGGARWTKSPEMVERIKADGQWNGRQWTYPPRLDHWRTFVRTVAERYQGKIRLYEIWNEPDIQFFRGTSAEYVELLAAAQQEIKSVDPDAVVISGGMAHIDHRNAKLDLYDMLLGEHTDLYDWFGYHKHGPFHNFTKDLDQLFARRAAAGGEVKPLYFNETGIATDRPREYVMATEFIKKLTYSWSLGAKGYHWFCLWVPEKDRENSAYGFRMFNEDFTPRPVWVAYNTAARYLRGREFSHTLDLGEGRYGFAFRGDGVFTGDGDDDYVLVVWTQDPGLAPAVRLLETNGAASVQEVGLMGVTRELPDAGGSAVVEIGHEPVLLVIDGADARPETFRELVEPGPGLVLIGDEPGEAAVTIHNPLDQAIAVSLRWSAEGEVKVAGDDEPRLRTVGPGQREVFAVPTRLRGGRAGEGGVAGSVVAVWKLGDAEAWQRSAIPVREARRLIGKPPAGREPDFVLDRADQVVNHSEVDPQTYAYRWLGPEDLSAKVWLHREASTLVLRIDVTDDEHRQPHYPRGMWQADSVQLGLALPGLDGYAELGVARADDGEVLTYTWVVPAGVDREASPWTRADVTRRGTTTRYDLAVDLAVLTAGSAVPQRLDFNLLLNESDESFREGYLQLAPGIGETKDPALFIPLSLETSGRP